jgi:predicted Zn-dependent peptidase
MSRKLKIIISIILLVLISAPIFLKKEKKFIKIFESTNSRGIKAYQIRVKNDNIIYVKGKFKNAGVLHNTPGNHGISVVVGDLIFRKINELSPEETKEQLKELGIGNLSVNALEDDFSFSFFVLKDKAAAALKFLSAAFDKPKFSKNDLEFVKSKYPRILDPETYFPKKLLFEKLLNMLYPSHNYGLPNTGTASALSSITENTVYDFIKSNFSKKRLEVFFAGDISQSEIELYTEAMFPELGEGEQESTQEEELNPPSESNGEIIYKNDMGNIVGIATGIRLDKLSNREKAAAHIVLKSLFDKKMGDFHAGLKSRNIAYSVELKHLQRRYSDVFCFFIFVDKNDLGKYEKYVQEKFSIYKRQLNMGNLSLFQESIMANLQNGFTNLENIDVQIENTLLPFSEITQKDFREIANKLFDLSLIRIVYIRSPDSSLMK